MLHTHFRNDVFDYFAIADIILFDRTNTLESLADEQTLWSYPDDVVYRLPNTFNSLRAWDFW